MRDEFSAPIKRTVAARAGHKCSNPECNAPTSGPQIESTKTLSVGVAAHITAAAQRGPRFDQEMSRKDRCSANNAVWLCQTCAKLIDNDPERFSRHVLIDWKRQAEADALAAIGKTTTSSSPLNKSHRDIQRNLRIRNKLERLLLRPPEERRVNRAHRPYEKFRRHKIVIRSLNDQLYPQADISPKGRISSWFEVEPYDFYHGGIEVILAVCLAVIGEDGGWKFTDRDSSFDETRYRLAKVWAIGRIPWRNIREIDPVGDREYRGPHLYCAFADNGTPYEEIVASEIGDDFDWLLDGTKQVSDITPAQSIDTGTDR